MDVFGIDIKIVSTPLIQKLGENSGKKSLKKILKEIKKLKTN